MLPIFSLPVLAENMGRGPQKSKILPQDIANKGWAIGLVAGYRYFIDNGRISLVDSQKKISDRLEYHNVEYLNSWLKTTQANRALRIISGTFDSECQQKNLTEKESEAIYINMLREIGYNFK